jgi:endonuclease YncB( thermonuclease family)
LTRSLPFPVDTYIRWFKVTEVHDGDTVTGQLDLGFHVWMTASCRLAGINARELAQPGGVEARNHLTGLILADMRLSVSSVQPDKYAGRFDALLWLPSGAEAGALMVKDGYAAPWDGTGPKPVPPWPIL